MTLLAHFDTASQGMLQRFARKVALFAAFAVIVSLLQPRGLVMVGVLLQMQCMVGSGLSVLSATFLRQPFAAESLTYWDEALAFSGLGMLSHIVTRLAYHPI